MRTKRTYDNRLHCQAKRGIYGYSKPLFFILFICCCCLPGFSQQALFEVISTENDRSAFPVKPAINKYILLQVDEAGLREHLRLAPLEFQPGGEPIALDIPLPNGETEVFSIEESPILAPHIAARHPEIKTYTGKGTVHPERVVRFSLTSSGFAGIILNVNGDAVYFEPQQKGSSRYVGYFTADATLPDVAQTNRCGVDEGEINGFRKHSENHTNGNNFNDMRNNTGGTLRTYEIAIAATGEFTDHAQYGNGDVNDAYNIIVNYVNNMAAVFRVELCVSFILVSDETIVYADPGTDPYDNDDQVAMLLENQQNLDIEIGVTNYDIGHVFGYAGGSGSGIAIGETVCFEDYQGRGVSGMCDLNNYPQVFNDQLVYHEVGHQFAMSHSYNSTIPVCTTRNPGTSVEPGAGATIMSYGFTCDTDDYESSYSPILQFHTVNYQEAYNYITNTDPGYGGSCPDNTATGNNLPAVTVPTNKTIPKSTPFLLTGSATDADPGDVLTYCWEGTNVGTSTPDATTLTDTSKPPFFRTYPATTSGTRTYPRLSAILDGTYSGMGDKLPSVGTMTTHRLTVKDNKSTGGSTVYAGVTVTIDGNSGPFSVDNLSGPYPGNSTQTITWDVANTTASPVNCANVDIMLSTDGGQTFPTTLLSGTANDGSQAVTLPNTPTNTARIMVKASNNVFFDISNGFQIQSSLPVEWVDFKVWVNNNRDALLTWQTGSESNNKGFEIEMANKDGAFKPVGFVAAFERQEYDFTVPGLNPGDYYFRLKQMDLDGSFDYSPVRSVTIFDHEAYTDLKLFPNPAGDELKLILPEKYTGVTTVHLVNNIGQITREISVEPTTTAFLVDIRHLSAGVYVLNIKSGQWVENLRFIKK